MIGRALGWLPAAVALAVAAASIPIFLLLWAGVASNATIVVFDVITAMVAIAVILRHAIVARADAADPRTRSRRAIYAAIGLLLPILVLAIAGAAGATAVNAHGEWDAWAIWNKHARFIFRDPAEWTRALSPLMQDSHPDYPLMLPLAVAAGWMAAGGDAVSVPVAIAALFMIATAMTLGASVARERGTARGIAAAAAVCASPAFLSWGAAQQADVPVAFFMLATFVAIARGLETGASTAWWAIAGLSASLAAWTKNEGLVLFAIVATVVVLWRWTDRRQVLPRGALGAFLAGALPPLVAVALFKFTVLTTANELAAQPWREVVRLVQQWPRWSQVATAMGHELWAGGAMTIGVLPIVAAFMLVTGIDARGRGAAVAALAAMTLALAAYLAVYVVTPYDLTWHLRSSVGRVVLHVLPTTIWAMFVLARRESID